MSSQMAFLRYVSYDVTHVFQITYAYECDFWCKQVASFLYVLCKLHMPNPYSPPLYKLLLLETGLQNIK